MSNSNFFFSSSGTNNQSFSDTDSMSFGTLIGLTFAATAVLGGISFAWFLYRRWSRVEVSRVEPAHAIGIDSAQAVAPAQSSVAIPAPRNNIQLITITNMSTGEIVQQVRRYPDGSNLPLPAETPPELSVIDVDDGSPSP